VRKKETKVDARPASRGRKKIQNFRRKPVFTVDLRGEKRNCSPASARGPNKEGREIAVTTGRVSLPSKKEEYTWAALGVHQPAGKDGVAGRENGKVSYRPGGKKREACGATARRENKQSSHCQRVATVLVPERKIAREKGEKKNLYVKGKMRGKSLSP